MRDNEENFVEISFEEAKKMVDENSKYFKPEGGRKYKLTFSKTQLCKKPVLKFGKNPATATEKDYEVKPVLQLVVESIDGKIIGKNWEILNWKLIKMFSDYLEADSVLTGIFIYEKTGSGTTTEHSLARIGEKKNSIKPNSETSANAEGFLFDEKRDG